MAVLFAGGADPRPTGRAAMGVIGMRLGPRTTSVIAMRVPREDADILVITAGGIGKRTPIDGVPPTQGRARGA